MAGFDADTLTFIADLAASPDAAFFDANRDRYRRHWLDPAKTFVEDAGALLRDERPSLQVDPRVNGSILHVRQDVRRGGGRAPYRDHLGLLFWEGERRDATSVLFLRLYPDRVVIGAGARALPPPRLRGYRRDVVTDDRGDDLVATVADLHHTGWEVHGRTLRRGPREPTSDDPDRAELLRHTALWASAELALPAVVGTRRFAGWCVRRWRQLLPLHSWLTRLDHAT